MTWYGHVHSYSRTCPVYQRVCMPGRPDGSATAPVHVLIGHAGAPFSWTINAPTPPYYDSVAVEHGYLRATANRTAVHVQARDRASPGSPVLLMPQHWLRCYIILELHCYISWGSSGAPSCPAAGFCA